MSGLWVRMLYSFSPTACHPVNKVALEIVLRLNSNSGVQPPSKSYYIAIARSVGLQDKILW